MPTYFLKNFMPSQPLWSTSQPFLSTNCQSQSLLIHIFYIIKTIKKRSKGSRAKCVMPRGPLSHPLVVGLTTRLHMKQVTAACQPTPHQNTIVSLELMQFTNWNPYYSSWNDFNPQFAKR